MTTVPVQKGDNLWKIARRALGPEDAKNSTKVANYVNSIIAANPDLKDPGIIQPDTNINLPDKDSVASSKNAKISKSTKHSKDVSVFANCKEALYTSDAPVSKCDVSSKDESEELYSSMDTAGKSSPKKASTLENCKEALYASDDPVSKCEDSCKDESEGLYTPKDGMGKCSFKATANKPEPSAAVVASNDDAERWFAYLMAVL